MPPDMPAFARYIGTDYSGAMGRQLRSRRCASSLVGRFEKRLLAVSFRCSLARLRSERAPKGRDVEQLLLNGKRGGDGIQDSAGERQ
jgi:hypothetical protein